MLMFDADFIFQLITWTQAHQKILGFFAVEFYFKITKSKSRHYFTQTFQ